MDKFLDLRYLIPMLIRKKVLESGFIGKGHLRVSLKELMGQLIETSLIF